MYGKAIARPAFTNISPTDATEYPGLKTAEEHAAFVGGVAEPSIYWDSKTHQYSLAHGARVAARRASQE